MNRQNVLSIRCSINGDPHPHYQWYQGDVSLHEKETKEKVLANEIDNNFHLHTKDGPESNYILTCMAKNNRGSKRQVFHVEIKN